MTDGVFDKSIVAAACRQCGFKNERTVGWMKRHSETECDHCGSTFPIIKPDQDTAPNELDRTIGGLRAMLRTRAAEEPPVEQKRGWFRRR